jgi:hypothetical protein
MTFLAGWKPKYDDPHVASVRFRCLTPLNELRRISFPIELYQPDRPYSVVIFSKLYDAANRALAAHLRAKGTCTILDLSDNHFYNPAGLAAYQRAAADIREMAQLVHRVVCCSAHLATVIQQNVDLKHAPVVVGDAVEEFDMPLTAPSPFAAAQGQPFRILWFGSHGSPNAPAGLEDLLRVQRHLAHAERTRRTELVVVSNNAEKFASVRDKLAVPARYVEWSEDAFPKELSRANLVVIPITPNPFTKCKSNNRLATALWYGIPAIADRIPAYDDLAPFCFLDDWEKGMAHALAHSRDLQVRTLAGSCYVRAQYNTRRIADDWRRIIKSAAAAAGTRPDVVS